MSTAAMLAVASLFVFRRPMSGGWTEQRTGVTALIVQSNENTTQRTN